jgi:hypothetical protein
MDNVFWIQNAESELNHCPHTPQGPYEPVVDQGLDL